METSGIGLSGVLLWLTLAIGVVVIGVPAAVIGCTVLLRARAARPGRTGAAPAALAESHARRVRRWSLGGLAAGVVAGLAFIAASRVPVALFCCPVCYLLGMLAGEVTARPAERDTRRAATLEGAIEILLLGAILIAAASSLDVPGPSVPPAASTAVSVMLWSGLACAPAAILSWLVLSGRTRRRPPRDAQPTMAA
jgi:hypothetical protein